MDFNREEYFSQTEICKLYKWSAKKVKRFIAEHQLETVNNTVTMFTPEGNKYELTTNYVKKKDFIKSLLKT